jgi:hypothetical protein
MAEVLIKTAETRPDPALQDNDLVHGMCDIRINTVHVCHICNMDLIYGPTAALNTALSTNYPYIAIPDGLRFRSNIDGLRHSGTIAEAYLAATKNFKIERVSNTEVIITNLRTLAEEMRSDKPDAKGRAIFVEQYLYGNNRSPGVVSHPRHKIFGTKGNEVWYSGNSSWSFPVFSDLWDAIESRCICERGDYTKFHWTEAEMKKYIVVTVDDFTLEEAGEMETPVYDEKVDPELLKARKYEIDWRNLPGITGEIIDNVNSKNTKVDIRDNFSFTRSQIIDTKQLAVG